MISEAFTNIKRGNKLLLPAERTQIAMLSLWTVFLSFSEAISIGILIPMISISLAPLKINSSRIFGLFNHVFGVRDSTAFILLMVVFTVILLAVKFAYALFILYKQQGIICNIYNRLTAATFSAYLRKPYPFHLRNNSSVLFKNISSEVSNFIFFSLSPFVVIASEFILLTGICLFLIFLYPMFMFFLLFMLGGLTLIINFFLKKRVAAYAHQREQYNSKMYKIALESLGAVKEINIYDAKNYFVNKFFDAIKRYSNAFMKFSIVSCVPRYIYEITIVLLLLLVIAYSILFHRQINDLIPMFTAIGIASIRLVASFSKIYANLNLFHYSGNSLDIISEVFLEPDYSRDNNKTQPQLFIDTTQPCIRLSNVSFKYENSQSFVLSDINLSIASGKITAIVGKTGSGKSTLIDIIATLFEPTKGELLFSEIIIDSKNKCFVRRIIGYVPQNIYLLDDSILSNIAFGVEPEQISYEKIRSIISVVQLESFIDSLSQGINTIVGENGVRISGGQKQRIAIARALYRDPEILIFDEATSALDNYTEQGLYEHLSQYKKGLTIILVTHRAHSLTNVDNIFLIDSGMIAGQGDFVYLSKNSVLFKEILHQSVQ